MPPPDLHELLALGERLAKEAGALLLDGLGRARTLVDTKTSKTDMVTEMDRAAEALIVGGIRAARPNDGILGEEGTDDPGTSGVRWVIDPLDGTTNYLYGFPHFGVSIAAEINGVTVVGVVANPRLGEVFTATAGGGAACNGEPISVSDTSELALALIGTGFSYDSERRARQGEALAKILPKVRDVRRAGSAATDLCWVACGRLDGFYERGLAPWDLAAGALIAREAGARVGPLSLDSYGLHFGLAAAPGIYDALAALVNETGASTA